MNAKLIFFDRIFTFFLLKKIKKMTYCIWGINQCYPLTYYLHILQSSVGLLHFYQEVA
jgi:hypothetical protein